MKRRKSIISAIGVAGLSIFSETLSGLKLFANEST